MAIIRVNLAPFEELENPNWWIPDAATFVLAFALAYAALTSHFDSIEEEIAALQTQTTEINGKIQGLTDQLNRVKELQKRKTTLETMRRSVYRITDSKLSKYLPVILVEHLQNLLPQGIWLETVNVSIGVNEDSDSEDDRPKGSLFGKKMRINGTSLDNIILAEFMTQLKATRNQETDPADLRTLVFFNDINLKFSDLKQQVLGEGQGALSAMNFELEVSYDEREGKAAINKEVSDIMEHYRQQNLAKVGKK